MTEPTPTMLVRIRNVSPRAALEVPLLRGRVVKRGEVVEVSLEQAQRLTRQDIWQYEATDIPSSATKPELLAHAASLGVAVPDGATKVTITALIEEHTTTPATGNEGE